jgi:preprotein translocase subunit SecE
MAIKEKNVEEKSKLVEVLTKEYRWENLLLGVLAVVSAGLALMIISGNPLLQINPNFPILGTEPNGTIFAWVLLVISIFGLILVIYPFFIPAFPEIKKIIWPNRAKFIDNTVRTLIFLFILTFVILIYNLLILRLLGDIL